MADRANQEGRGHDARNRRPARAGRLHDRSAELGLRQLRHPLQGLHHAGQASLRARQDRLADSLQQIYAALEEDQRLLLEYKFFEPYFYAMDIPDWGTSLLHCLSLGERAQVVLDTGHHAPGTNIEFIVM